MTRSPRFATPSIEVERRPVDVQVQRSREVDRGEPVPGRIEETVATLRLRVSLIAALVEALFDPAGPDAIRVR